MRRELFQKRLIARRRKLTLARAEQGLHRLLAGVAADGTHLADWVLSWVAHVDAIEREPQPGDALMERVAIGFDELRLLMPRRRGEAMTLREVFVVDDAAIARAFGRATPRVLDLRVRVADIANLLGVDVAETVELFDDSLDEVAPPRRGPRRG